MRIKSKNVRPQIYLHMLQTMLRQLIKEARVGPVAKHILSGVGRVSGVEVEIRQIKFAALNFWLTARRKVPMARPEDRAYPSGSTRRS